MTMFTALPAYLATSSNAVVSMLSVLPVYSVYALMVWLSIGLSVPDKSSFPIILVLCVLCIGLNSDIEVKQVLHQRPSS